MRETPNPFVARRPTSAGGLCRMMARACWVAALLPGLVAAAPPVAPSRPVQDVLHGVKVDDPYRNLENLGDPQTRAWLQAQGAAADAQLGRIEGRDAMVRRLDELARTSGDSVRAITRMPGDRLYYLKRRSGENQYKLMLRVGTTGAERVLVDPEKLRAATGTPHAINYFAPSWDGRMLAYGISAGGSEDASLQLMDIASGKAVGRPIPGSARTWCAGRPTAAT